MSIYEMLKRMDSTVIKECGTGATDREIDDAESALDVRFPESYRAFLSTFGWARIFSDPIYGVGASVPRPYALVENVLSERYECEPNIPHQLVPIMNDGAGNNYCLDTAAFRGQECPVVFWDHEHYDGPNQMPEQVSPSFDRWIIDLIIEAPPDDA